MFDIRFTGKTADAQTELLHLGTINLGDVKEGFAASLSFWSQEVYERQWLDAAKRLLEPDAHSAFITCMYDPRTTYDIFWWPAWRSADIVVFQQQLLFIGAKEGETGWSRTTEFSVENPYAAVMDWDSTHSEECRRTGVCRHARLGKPPPDASIDLCPSEWCVQLREVQEFVERVTRLGAGQAH